MSRRPANFTQADIARVLRAAQQVGATSVVVKVGDTEVTIGLDYGKPPPVEKPKIRLY
jgi:hypothetical protein